MAGAKFDETVRAMELLLTRRQIERIMARTYTGSSRVQVLRNAVNLGLDQIEKDHRRNYPSREPQGWRVA